MVGKLCWKAILDFCTDAIQGQKDSWFLLSTPGDDLKDFSKSAAISAIENEINLKWASVQSGI